MKIAQSSHIQAHGYDEESGHLTIQFTNGAIHRYSGVSPALYDSFSKASSPGSFFHEHIRKLDNQKVVKADKLRKRTLK